MLILAILVVALAACGTGASSSEPPAPSEPAAPSVQPSAEPSPEPSVEPSEAPAPEERDVAGTITVFEGTFSGPGGTIQEALDNGPDTEYPSLVNGVIFRDSDGTVYLATSVSDTSVPTFDGRCSRS